MKKPELSLQTDIINCARATGHVVDKFHDEFTSGIADLFIGSPVQGIWLELKYKQLPKRSSTPFNIKIPGDQLVWLQDHYLRPLPSAVMVGTNGGWMVIPTPYLNHYLIDTPAHNHYQLLSMLKPTLTTIMVSFNQLLEAV